MTIKIVFDKDASLKGLKTGWGISYLVNDSVLFDAGERASDLLDNIKLLNIDARKITKIVISHNHWGHWGGLWGVLKINNKAQIFAGSDFIGEHKEEIKGYNFNEVGASEEIDAAVFTTGCLKAAHKGQDIYEQALILKTDKGISIICGCAHPGLLEIIDKAQNLSRTIKPQVQDFAPQKGKACGASFAESKIYSVLGGFHLIDKDKRFIRYLTEEVKKKGIERVGPAHCTGYEAMNLFKESFGDNFLEIKAGVEINV